MTLARLLKRTIFFYWRTSLGLALCVTLASTILTGALLLGDSVRYSLAAMLEARLGTTEFALAPSDRFFRAVLADSLQKQLKTTVAPILATRAMLACADGSRRVNAVNLFGVEDRFYQIGRAETPFRSAPPDAIVLNEPLAAALKVSVGDEMVLRFQKPSWLPRDAAIIPETDLTAAGRVTVTAIATNQSFGRFSLRADQREPLNAFVPLRWLGDKLGRLGQANMILVSAGPHRLTVEDLAVALKKSWQLADAGLELRYSPTGDLIELRSRRILIDTAVAEPALQIDPSAIGIFTYFVNELRHGDCVCPYSFVTAMSPSPDLPSILRDLNDDEILITQWLAEDLQAKPGDTIELSYYVLGPARTLHQATTSFRVAGIVPVDSSLLDPQLMPDLPGLADVENCRDWEPGIPIDLDKIRQKDQDYWQRYRGTPKAVITLATAQRIWANRYGSLTAVRYNANRISPDLLARRLREAIAPAAVGLFFLPVRQHGLKAQTQSTDFGQLFLGLSMFLIVSALILTTLVFVFGIENRSQQIGLFKAVGLPKSWLWKTFLCEALLLAVLASVAGATLALLYTKLMIHALGTLWSDVVSGSAISFGATGRSLVLGPFATVIVSILAVALSLRRHLARDATALLAGPESGPYLLDTHRPKRYLWALASGICFVAALALIFGTEARTSDSAAALFFGSASLLLAGALGFCYYFVATLGAGLNRPLLSLAGLGLRNTARRPGRSLAVITMLACGIFLVIAVAANRTDPLADAHNRASGTGGFALYAETTVPILDDLNNPASQKKFGLAPRTFRNVSFVPFRLRAGDDASCFNLNRAQMPTLLGVDPNLLQQRAAFTFTRTLATAERDAGWDLLNLDLGPGVIPAVGDYPTVYWALHKSVGDQLEYYSEDGRIIRLCIVGMLKNSVLQGSLLISETNFIKLFPSRSGYNVLLIDSAGDHKAVARALAERLKDFGLSVVPTTQRLAAFAAVEHTYLSIFLLLGALGLLLGTGGLGLVVLRNMLERRRELAMMQAVGLNKTALKKIVFFEHALLVWLGLACGLVAAVVAVLPALKSPAADMPYRSVLLASVLICVSAVSWIYFATTLALRAPILDALRHE